MPYKDLQEFIKCLENHDQIKRINEPVSHLLEIAEFTQRVSRRQGPALIFKNIPGHHLPVITNTFGSPQRIALALDTSDLDQLGEDVAKFIETKTPNSPSQKIPESIRQRIANSTPTTVTNAPCQELTFYDDEIDLYAIPILKCWPEDGGQAITLPVVLTKNPESGERNVGMYRMQIYDKKTTGMHWRPNTGGAKHFQIAERLGKDLEVAVAIGPEPALTYAATAPLPYNIDEILFAGFLRRAPIELVKCKTIDMEVPASSQIILEGYVRCGSRRLEGPFGNHTGYYSPAEEYPVFHVTCLTMRKDAIYPATVVGQPPQEDCFWAKATERLFLPILKKTFPEIVDINMPVEGIFNNMAFISIRKKYPGHAKEVINALWNTEWMMLRKIICIFDEDVNVQCLSEVIWRLGNNIDPKRDIIFVDGPVDSLNPASPVPSYGSKMGIDCTRKDRKEGLKRTWPPTMKMEQEVEKKVDRLLSRLGLI